MDNIAVLLSNYLNPTETFIYQRIVNFSAFKPIVLSYGTNNPKEFPHSPVYSFSSLIPFAEGLQRSLFTNLKFSPYFKNILRSNNVKLLQVHFAVRAIEARWLSEKLGIPQANFFHGSDLDAYKNDEKKKQQLIELINSTAASITASEKMKGELVDMGCDGGKIFVNYAGIDLSKFKFKPRKFEKGRKIRFLMCGRLFWKKGFEYGIEAFAMAAKKHPNIEMRIVGDGELKEALIKKVQNLGLSDRIAFIGNLPPNGIPKEMYEADIFLAPSLEEGMPNVIKEALASGMPVISTYAGGIPEIIKGGINGLLVEGKNAEQLAQKISYLIENPQMWQPLEEAGRETIEENFDVKEQMMKLESLYKEIIGKWKKRQ